MVVYSIIIYLVAFIKQKLHCVSEMNLGNSVQHTPSSCTIPSDVETEGITRGARLFLTKQKQANLEI